MQETKKAGQISETVKALYRMFLIHGGFVAEHIMSFKEYSREHCVEEIKIVSADREYELDLRITKPEFIIYMDIRHFVQRYNDASVIKFMV